MDCYGTHPVRARLGRIGGKFVMDLSSQFTPEHPLILVGAGRMGGALLSGWLGRGLDPNAISIIDPSPPSDTAQMLAKAGIRAEAQPPIGVQARVIVIAVKPQVIGEILVALRVLVGDETTALSIAAGTSLASL